MKWPRKNSSSSLITRVFPVSWFAKFKQKRGNQEQTSAKNSVLDVPSPIPSSYREGRFYSLDEDDAFWRISFSDDRIQPRRSTGGINPLRHDYDARDLQNPVFSDFKRFGLAEGDEDSGKGDCRNFSEMVSDIKKMRERRGKQRVINNVAAVRHEENAGAEREVFPVHESDSVVSNSRNVTKNPIKEIKTRSKAKENNNIMGVKAYSPRTECKIRALEEMKRARARRRGKKKEAKSVFERFAVVKRSVDPEGDFKESMMEMIREKGIGDPDDLEQLLACYLSLNCDQYHNLIIAVFQQVWIELKGTSINPFIID